MSTKAEQRIAVAKDVLARIKAEQFVARQGFNYVDFTDQNTQVTGLHPAGDLVGVIRGRKCTVCAKGAMFMARINVADKLPKLLVCEGQYENDTEELNGVGHDAACEPLLAIWSQDQLDLIEEAFEWSYYHSDESNSDAKIRRLAAFAKKYNDATSRLQAIMRNIIRNNGTFVLPKGK